MFRKLLLSLAVSTAIVAAPAHATLQENPDIYVVNGWQNPDGYWFLVYNDGSYCYFYVDNGQMKDYHFIQCSGGAV